MLAEKAVSNVSTDHLFLEIFNASKTPSLLLVPNETNFTIQFANEAYLQLFCGYREDCIDQRFTTFLDKKLTAVNSAALLASAINSIKTKTTDCISTQPYALQSDYGRIFYWQIEHKPIFSADGSVQYILHTIIDKTEIVNHEKQLQEAETKARFHFEHSAYPMLIWDFESKDIIDVNQKAIECYGYTREEFLKLSTKQLRPPEDLEMFLNATKDIESYGHRHHRIWRHLKKSGEVMFMEVSAFVTNIDGRVVSITHNQDVTERLKAEKELRESQERYESLFTGANDAIFVADASTGILTDANDQACILVGRPKEELIGLHQTKLHPPEELEFIAEQFKLFVGTDSWKGIETFVLHKNGHKVPVSITSGKTFQTGEKKYAVAYFHDLTRRKKVQSELEKTTRLLQKAEEIAEIGSVDIDVNTEERFYSEGFKKIVGITDDKKNHFANDFLELVHPEDQLKHIEWINKLGENVEDIISNEIRIKRKTDGEERILWIHGISLKDEEGNVTKRIGVIKDITERKQLETELLRSHYQLKKLTEEVPLGILQMEKMGSENPTIKFVSKAIETIHTGLTAEGVIQNASLLFNRIHPEDFDLVVNSSNQSVEKLTNVDIEFRATDVVEGIKWIRLAYHPERNEDGSTSLYGYFQDITKEKKMLESLENQNKELRDIAWIQSHTVRAPLTRLMGLASLMERGKAKEIGMEDYFMENILSTCNELDAIIREIVEKANNIT